MPEVHLHNMFGTHRRNHPVMSIDKDGAKKDTVVVAKTDGDEEKDVDPEKAFFATNPPLAPTFSAGTSGVAEIAFDSCLQDVLKYLWMRRDEKIEVEKIARKLAELQFEKKNDEILAAHHAEQNGGAEENDGLTEDQEEEFEDDFSEFSGKDGESVAEDE